MPVGNPNGYGDVFTRSMSQPMFPGASGYGGSVTLGNVVRARQAANAQTGRSTSQTANRSINSKLGSGAAATGRRRGFGARMKPMFGRGSRGLGIDMGGFGSTTGPSSLPRPNFGTIAEQRAANAEDYARRGVNLTRPPRPNFGTIAEQRVANILSGERDARGYANGFNRGNAYPNFGTIAEQRAANAEDYARRGVNLARPSRPIISANPNVGIADLKAASNSLFGQALQHARDAEAFNRRTGAGTPRGRAPMRPNASGGGMPTGTSAPPPVKPRSSGGAGAFSKMSGRTKVGLALSAAVIGGLAYSGRRGEGSSGGRTSMSRY